MPPSPPLVESGWFALFWRSITPFLRQQEVIALRRQKLTGYEIIRRTGLSRAIVSPLLRRARLRRWRDLFPAVPVVRSSLRIRPQTACLQTSSGSYAMFDDFALIKQ